MHMGHFAVLLIVLVLGYWLGQSQPNLVGGYPNKLLAGLGGS